MAFLVFSLGTPGENPLAILTLSSHSSASWGSFQVCWLAQPFPPADLIDPPLPWQRPEAAGRGEAGPSRGLGPQRGPAYKWAPPRERASGPGRSPALKKGSAQKEVRASVAGFRGSSGALTDSFRA